MWHSIGESADCTRDVLVERVSRLEAELLSKASTLHGYEVLITSMQNELVSASLEKEKALLKSTGSPLTPRTMDAALEIEGQVSLESPKNDDEYIKLLHDRDSIRGALVSQLSGNVLALINILALTFAVLLSSP